jgi:hypothetical protein
MSSIRDTFSSLLSRVLTYEGPRPLTTETTFQAGYDRQTSLPPHSQTRWLLSDLEGAIACADSGNLRIVGQLCKSFRRDGVISGVLSTRTEGLVQLPMRFSGDDEYVAELEKEFRHVFPTSELALLSGDGRLAGVGVGEFVQIVGRLPVLKRLDPQFLWYRWFEDRWYYQSTKGFLPINPGDGRWVLHCPGGAVQPWTNGLWSALARAYIAKEHAYFYRENYSSKLANAARAAVSPAGASEAIRQGFFKKLAAWGVNTVFDLPPGWDVKLLESNGRGFEVFEQTIKDCNEEAIITIAGQLVTTTGGAGFSNANIHSTIRSDLIQADADALASTLNTQAIPVWQNERFGAGALERPVMCGWDVTPPKDLTGEATAMTQLGNAVAALNAALQSYGKRVDVDAIALRFGVPVEKLVAEAATSLAPANDTARPPLQAIAGGRGR